MGLEKLIGLFEQTQIAMHRQAGRAVNTALVVRNWVFGWYIVEFEKNRSEREELYGQSLMIQLSEKLSKRLGNSFPGVHLTSTVNFTNITKRFGRHCLPNWFRKISLKPLPIY
jgi:hypothetical protein